MTDAEKLAEYEAMRAEVELAYRNTLETLDKLKAQGKTKTVTYRENLGWKAYYRAMLDLYRKHGLGSR